MGVVVEVEIFEARAHSVEFWTLAEAE